MTIFDYLVIIALCASVVISTMRGLVKEILSLVCWIVAFVVANLYGPALAPLLPAMVPGEAVRLMVGFIAVFLGARILMGLVIKAILSLVKAGGLSLADHSLGGVFGLARGVVIVLAAVIVCGLTSMPQQAYWKEALLSPLVETGVRTVKPFLPSAMAEHVHY